MYLTTDEIYTTIFAESVEAISGEDTTMLTAAIDGAIAEATGYLHAFDKAAIFAATGSARNALLLIFIKDIAVWHFIAIANPGIDIKVRENRYNAAVAWLKGVQRGDIVPDLPRVANATPVSGFEMGSNVKRNNHF